MGDMDGYEARLADIGAELERINFSYRVEYNRPRDYWEDRIMLFERHAGKVLEYYGQACAMAGVMGCGSSDLERGMGRFREMKDEMISMMREVARTPSVMNKRDGQQSRWSRELRARLEGHGGGCLSLEREMNETFRRLCGSWRDGSHAS